ncbi:hypothetical protein [Crenobacter luteus]|uniref:hypothetical protein n=1 Tax=Crenobacter luteus TaxID=1452487 RepID=UPI00104ED59F|nr:hypothetical protein [Crenobacter luteus]
MGARHFFIRRRAAGILQFACLKNGTISGSSIRSFYCCGGVGFILPLCARMSVFIVGGVDFYIADAAVIKPFPVPFFTAVLAFD